MSESPNCGWLLVVPAGNHLSYSRYKVVYPIKIKNNIFGNIEDKSSNSKIILLIKLIKQIYYETVFQSEQHSEFFSTNWINLKFEDTVAIHHQASAYDEFSLLVEVGSSLGMNIFFFRNCR